MAYFLWDDDGVIQMIEALTPGFLTPFKSLAANVERSDVFRIMVSNNFGGIVRFAPWQLYTCDSVFYLFVRRRCGLTRYFFLSY
jgi:hypothetical protein